MNLLPWEYLFLPFNARNFHDIFWPIVVAAGASLAITVVLYNVRTRRFHGHGPYLDMYEYILWTSLITFSLVVFVYSIFQFDFFFVPTTLVSGIGTLVWVRFRRVPPMFAAYETRLAKMRYFSRSKYAHPEATIRPRAERTRSGRPVRVGASKRNRKRR